MVNLLLVIWTFFVTNALDPVQYMKENGLDLITMRIHSPKNSYYIFPLPQLDSLLDTEQRAIFSEVHVGKVPTSTDMIMECPDLQSYGINAIGYDTFRIAQSAPWLIGFLIAKTKGYCGANFPLYEVRYGTGSNIIYKYPARVDSIPKNATLLGYIWKYPHLLKSEENAIQAEVTKMDKLLYKIITTRVPEYQLSYTLFQGTLQNFLSKGYFYHPVIGHVIGGGQLPAHIAKRCPLLRKINIYKSDLLTYMGFDITSEFSNKPDNFTTKNSFYCAPYMGYCGAYLNLRRLPSKKKDADFLYSTDNAEVKQLFNSGYKFSIGSPTPQSVCWIWYPHRPTLNSIAASPKAAIRKANVRLIRGHWTSGANKGFHVYSTKAAKFDNWVKNGKFKRGVDFGFVALEKTAPLKQCPSLIMMKIYQEQGGRQRTFIGGNSFPTEHTKGKWVLENKFYCAPYSGYCGATKNLWVYRSWKNDRDLEYMTNSTRALILEKTKEYYTYQLCWIWQI